MSRMEKRLSNEPGSHRNDDSRRPVWLEATDSFYKKLNRIARECEPSRYPGVEQGIGCFCYVNFRSGTLP
jgi:hypothetical protein